MNPQSVPEVVKILASMQNNGELHEFPQRKNKVKIGSNYTPPKKKRKKK